jgi:hypothetical protein
MLKFKISVAAIQIFTSRLGGELKKGQSAKVKEKRRGYKEKNDVKQN